MIQLCHACLSSVLDSCRDKDINNPDLSGVCLHEDVCYVASALFVQGAAVYPADVPIRPLHLLTHPTDFPITPTQPHILLAVIRHTRSLQLTDVHIMHCCWGYCLCCAAIKTPVRSQSMRMWKGVFWIIKWLEEKEIVTDSAKHSWYTAELPAL